MLAQWGQTIFRTAYRIFELAKDIQLIGSMEWGDGLVDGREFSEVLGSHTEKHGGRRGCAVPAASSRGG